MTVTLESQHRIEDTHLVGGCGDIDDLGYVGMKALERAFRRFGIECAGRHMARYEVVQ
jgi:hypothetical protein